MGILTFKGGVHPYDGKELSKEKPITPIDNSAISCKQNCICPPGTARKCTQRRQVPGSVAFVPSVVGLIIAGEIIKDLTDLN